MVMVMAAGLPMQLDFSTAEAEARELAARDLGVVRLHPRNQHEEDQMREMLVLAEMKQAFGPIDQIPQECVSEARAQVEREIKTAHAVVLAARRAALARGRWRRIAWTVCVFVLFRKSVKRSFAPGGAGFKRARAEFFMLA